MYSKLVKTIIYYEDDKACMIDNHVRMYVTHINRLFEIFDFSKIIKIPEDFNIVSYQECSPREAILHYLFSQKECEEPTIDYHKIPQEYLRMLSCYKIDELYNMKTFPYTKEKFQRLRALGLKLCQNLQNYGVAAFEDWCLENWGSISNSVDYKRITWEGHDAIAFYTYDLAEPRKIYEKLGRGTSYNQFMHVIYANTDNDYSWCDETYEHGELVESEENEYDSEDDYDMHRKIMYA